MPMRTPGARIKRKSGRPKSPGRAVSRTIYLKHDEDEALIRAAEITATTVSAFIRSAALIAARAQA